MNVAFAAILGAADSVSAGFAEQCALAGPGNCAFAEPNSTMSSIAHRVVDLINVGLLFERVKFVISPYIRY